MEEKPVYGLRKYGKQLVAVALGIVALGTSQLVSADTWVANSPESIEIESGATSYQLKLGDTLWAVSQKVNVSVETLAQLSDVDLASGQQYHLPVGYTVRWNADQTKYQLVSPDDVVINEVEPDSSTDVSQSKALDPTVVPDVDVNATRIKDNKAIVEQLSAMKNHENSSAMVIHNDSTNEEVYIVPIPANQNTDGSVLDDSQSINDSNTNDVNYLVLTAKDSKEVFTWAEFAKDKNIANEVVGRISIYTQSDLEAYLAQTGLDLTGDSVWFYNTEDIIFPKGTYVVDNGYFDFYLPSAIGNVDFNGSILLIGNGVVTGRATGDQNDRTVLWYDWY